MKTSEKQKSSGKSGTAFFILILVVIGQLYLLRNYISKIGIFFLPLPFYIEALFHLLFFCGIILCHFYPLGLMNRRNRLPVYGIFLLYTLCNIICYPTYIQAYLTGYPFTYESSAGALTALKPVLIFIGIISEIPTPGIMDGREYSRRLREKVQAQDAKWANDSVKSSCKELSETMKKMRASLSDEEYASFLKEFQKERPS